MKENITIPEQHTGSQLDITHSIFASSLIDAQRAFETASQRLLDVNRWGELSGPLSARFHLIDDGTGEVAHRAAEQGDYLRINIPGPGTTTGDGYDWARIEALDSYFDPAHDSYICAMRVRPVSSPVSHEDDVAHFFQEKASSTFMIEREGNRVTASIHGRNELPNTHTHHSGDNVRNAVVASGAVSGLSRLQWTALVNGLLENLA